MVSFLFITLLIRLRSRATSAATDSTAIQRETLFFIIPPKVMICQMHVTLCLTAHRTRGMVIPCWF
jgi:hypothetical protein